MQSGIQNPRFIPTESCANVESHPSDSAHCPYHDWPKAGMTSNVNRPRSEMKARRRVAETVSERDGRCAGGGYMFMIGGNCVNDVAGSLIVMGKRRSIAPIILAHWKSGDDSRFGSIVPPAGVPSREIVEMPVIAALRSSSCVLNCLRNRGSAIFCQLPLWKKART